MTLTRREVLTRSLLGVFPAAAQVGAVPEQQQGADTAVARLRQPQMAGRPREPITDYENDPFIIGVEERLRCTCGCNLDVYTCRTTDFTCQTSPAMHREVVALVEQDMTAEEILDAFVAQYGEMVLMAPRKEGFNIVGYVLPGVVITFIGGAMLWILGRRVQLRRAATEASSGDGGFGAELSAEDAARLEAELAELER